MQPVCNQLTVTLDSINVAELQDQPLTAAEQDIQSESTEATELPTEATEPTNEQEEELEQSAGPSSNEISQL